MITAKNILRHELIGLDVHVVDAKNSYLKGIVGIVIDETKNTVLILTLKGPKMAPKNGAIFRFTLPSRVRVEVDGSVLVMAPERRISMRIKDPGVRKTGLHRGPVSGSLEHRGS